MSGLSGAVGGRRIVEVLAQVDGVVGVGVAVHLGHQVGGVDERGHFRVRATCSSRKEHLPAVCGTSGKDDLGVRVVASGGLPGKYDLVVDDPDERSDVRDGDPALVVRPVDNVWILF